MPLPLPRVFGLLVTALLPALAGGCALLAPAAPEPAPLQAFGPWQVQGCTISTQAADVWLRTTGALTSRSELEFKAQFTPVLVRPPFATMTGAAFPIRTEGTNRSYTLMVPYTAESGAVMLQTGAYLTLTYQPLGSADLQDVSFATKPLMEALGRLRDCP